MRGLFSFASMCESFSKIIGFFRSLSKEDSHTDMKALKIVACVIVLAVCVTGTYYTVYSIKNIKTKPPIVEVQSPKVDPSLSPEFTPTPTPTITPAPTAYQIVVVLEGSGNVKIRSSPRQDSYALGSLSEGNYALYLGLSEQDLSGVNWHYIEYNDGLHIIRGWITSRYTETRQINYYN